MQALDYEFIAYPKIISGECALESIPAEMAANDAFKPLVVASRRAVGRGFGKTLVRAFSDSGCIIGGIYDEVRDYAGIGLAREAAFLFRQRGCDAFIALGGALAANVARAANILATENADTLFPFFAGASLPGRLNPFILVPTGCATGTGAGKTLVIDNRRLVSDVFFPDVVVADKKMTPAPSRRCAAESAILSMDNAFSAFSGDACNPMRSAFAGAALDLLRTFMDGFLRRPAAGKQSLAMANAAVLSSIAAANASPGAVRILSEELEKITGISKAVFVANLTPGAIFRARKEYGPYPDDLLLAVSGMAVFSATPAEQRSKKGVEMFLDLFESAACAISDPSVSKIPAYQLARALENAGKREEEGFSVHEGRALLELARQETAW